MKIKSETGHWTQNKQASVVENMVAGCDPNVAEFSVDKVNVKRVLVLVSLHIRTLFNISLTNFESIQHSVHHVIKQGLPRFQAVRGHLFLRRHVLTL